MQTAEKKKRTVLVVGGGVAGCRRPSIWRAADTGSTSSRAATTSAARWRSSTSSTRRTTAPSAPSGPRSAAARKIRPSPFHAHGRVETLEKANGGYRAVIAKSTPVIDPELCIYCGRCESACPKGVARPIWEHAYPPVYLIDGGSMRGVPRLCGCVSHKGHRLRARRDTDGTCR